MTFHAVHLQGGFDFDATLQALGTTSTILVTELILTQALLGTSLSDSLEISVGTFFGILFGNASLMAVVFFTALSL